MKAITLFGAKFTGMQEIAQQTASKLGWQMIDDREVIKRTCDKYPITAGQIEKSICRKPTFRSNFSPKRLKLIAALKNTLSDMAARESAVYCGFLGQLIPSDLSLRVLVLAGLPHRSEKVFRDEGIIGERALSRIRKEDQNLFSWTRYLRDDGKWKESAFDITILSENTHQEQSFDIILQALEKKSTHRVDEEAAVKNFKLASKVEYTLAQKGLNVGVAVKDRRVDLTIHSPVTFLTRFENKLKRTVAGIPDVRKVRVHVGNRFYRANIWTNLELQLHTKPLNEKIEKAFTQIYDEMTENKSLSIEHKPEAHQRLWT